MHPSSTIALDSLMANPFRFLLHLLLVWITTLYYRTTHCSAAHNVRVTLQPHSTLYITTSQYALHYNLTVICTMQSHYFRTTLYFGVMKKILDTLTKGIAFSVSETLVGLTYGSVDTD